MGAGAGNLRDNSGESYVVFGGAFLPSTLDLGSLGTAGVTIFGADSNDQSGSSVSGAGDVNGDGIYDILIGASNSEGIGNSEAVAGEAYLIYGSQTLPLTIDLATLGTAGVTVYGSDVGDECGTSVSDIGDVNNDGFDDIVIGANKGDGVASVKNGAGESYLVFG